MYYLISSIFLEHVNWYNVILDNLQSRWRKDQRMMHLQSPELDLAQPLACERDRDRAVNSSSFFLEMEMKNHLGSEINSERFSSWSLMRPQELNFLHFLSPKALKVREQVSVDVISHLLQQCPQQLWPKTEIESANLMGNLGEA